MWLRTRGAKGVAVCYKCFMATPRQVWISPRFKGSHGMLMQIINGVVLQLRTICKWKFIHDMEKFVEKSYEARAAGRGKDVIGIVTAAEKEACQLNVTEVTRSFHHCLASVTVVNVSGITDPLRSSPR